MNLKSKENKLISTQTTPDQVFQIVATTPKNHQRARTATASTFLKEQIQMRI